MPLGLVFGAGPSGADTSPATGGWYWAGQPDAQPPPVGALPAPVPTPDVPNGDVASGYRPSGPDKATFLHVASEIGDGTTVSSVILTIKEDSTAPALNVSPDAAKINAKPATDFWLDGAKGAPMSQAPKVDENVSVAGKRNASDGTWTFDLTSIAQQWASGVMPNAGIGLIPDQSGGTFQVVWKLDTATVDVETGSGDPSENLNLGAVDGSSSTPTDSSSTGSVGDVSTAPALSGDTSSSFTPSSDGTTNAAPPATTAAPPTTTPQVALGPDKTKKAVSKGGLPAGFFLGALAGIGLLGGVAVALGDLGEPDVPREGSVVRRLERRAAPSR